MPGVLGPIVHRHNSYQQMSPMGLESVIHNNDVSARLVRDGFKINQDWRSSHVNDFNTGVAANVYSAPDNQHEHHYAPRQAYSTTPDAVGYPPAAHDGHNAQEGYDGSGWWPGANGAEGHMGWPASARTKTEDVDGGNTANPVFRNHG